VTAAADLSCFNDEELRAIQRRFRSHFDLLCRGAFDEEMSKSQHGLEPMRALVLTDFVHGQSQASYRTVTDELYRRELSRNSAKTLASVVN